MVRMLTRFRASLRVADADAGGRPRPMLRRAACSCRRCPPGRRPAPTTPRAPLTGSIGPERRRRLRRLARSGLERRDDRLGDARAGGRRPQPLRRHARAATRRSTSCAATSASSAAPATSPARSSPSRAPAPIRAPSAGATWSPRCSTGGPRTAPSTAGPPRPRSRSSRCAPPAPRAVSASALLADEGAERRRRLGRRARGAEQRRRHRRGDAGDARHEGRPGRARLPAQAPARRRRLRARRRRRGQLAVDRLGGAGDDRGRRRPGEGERRRRQEPLDYLAARQAEDGHYRYSASSDQTPVWVTAQALAAVAGEAMPLAVPPRAAAARHAIARADLPALAGHGPTCRQPRRPCPNRARPVPRPERRCRPRRLPRRRARPRRARRRLRRRRGGRRPGSLDPGSGRRPNRARVTASGTSPSPWLPLGVGALATAWRSACPGGCGRRFAW